MVIEDYLTYDEPVCDRVWRAFCPTARPPPNLHVALDLFETDVKERWDWKRQITLRHILTHSASLWSALPAKLTTKSMSSCEQCVTAFEFNHLAPEDTILPTSAPGSKVEYHFMSFGWLVAGALTSAYALKHNLDPKAVTFQQVYKAILAPRLSMETLNSGFRPFGGGGGGTFPMAFTETDDISLSSVLQLEREASAQGETKDADAGDAADAMLQHIRESLRGKEFILDQRVWNCEEGLHANCPSAGGRFSARGLANFYRDLSAGKLLDKATLESVSAVVACDTLTNTTQGQTDTAGSNDADIHGRTLDFGYQLIRFESDGESNVLAEPKAFGHDSGISVGVMLNKSNADETVSKRIIQTIAKHFGWYEFVDEHVISDCTSSGSGSEVTDQLGEWPIACALRCVPVCTGTEYSLIKLVPYCRLKKQIMENVGGLFFA